MENENMDVIVTEKKTLRQKIKDNWKSIAKIGGIIGGIGAAALFVRKITSGEDEEIIDADFVEGEGTQDKNEDAA